MEYLRSCLQKRCSVKLEYEGKEVRTLLRSKFVVKRRYVFMCVLHRLCEPCNVA